MFTRILLFACLLLTAIAFQAQDEKDTSVGTWDWSIELPDQGVMTGTFIITKGDEGHEMVISSAQGETKVNSLKIEANKLVKGFIYYEGSQVDFAGTFEGDTYTGSLSVDGYELPIVGTRKKD